MSPRETALRNDRDQHGRTRAPGEWSSPALWRGIVSGHLSVVGTFVRGDRRYLLVRRNAVSHAVRHALTPRECEVAERVCLGLSNKEIAYELRIAVPTVAGRLTRALRRLGLKSRLELARLMPPGAIAERVEMTMDARRATK